MDQPLNQKQIQLFQYEALWDEKERQKYEKGLNQVKSLEQVKKFKDIILQSIKTVFDKSIFQQGMSNPRKIKLEVEAYFRIYQQMRVDANNGEQSKKKLARSKGILDVLVRSIIASKLHGEGNKLFQLLWEKAKQNLLKQYVKNNRIQKIQEYISVVQGHNSLKQPIRLIIEDKNVFQSIKLAYKKQKKSQLATIYYFCKSIQFEGGLNQLQLKIIQYMKKDMKKKDKKRIFNEQQILNYSKQQIKKKREQIKRRQNKKRKKEQNNRNQLNPINQRLNQNVAQQNINQNSNENSENQSNSESSVDSIDRINESNDNYSNIPLSLVLQSSSDQRIKKYNRKRKEKLLIRKQNDSLEEQINYNRNYTYGQHKRTKITRSNIMQQNKQRQFERSRSKQQRRAMKRRNQQIQGRKI